VEAYNSCDKELLKPCYNVLSLPNISLCTHLISMEGQRMWPDMGQNILSR